MSYGKKSHLFRPVDESMLVHIERMFPHTSRHVRPVYHILTDHCVVETLLLVTLLDMMNRYEQGDRSTHGIATGVLLSLRSKDGRTKFQTAEMELVHDVLVELQMAGMNFSRLQGYLREHGMQIVFMHSCGGDITDPGSVDTYYELVKHEQLKRTTLDWTGDTLKGVSVRYASTHGIDALRTITTMHRITTITEQLVSGMTTERMLLNRTEQATFV